MYDAHEAFEIDKTKMKMLVPLDMNNQRIMNVNYDLIFGDLFEIIKCTLIYDPSSQNVYRVLHKSINGRVSPLSKYINTKLLLTNVTHFR